jgi:hypothetical protein
VVVRRIMRCSRPMTLAVGVPQLHRQAPVAYEYPNLGI